MWCTTNPFQQEALREERRLRIEQIRETEEFQYGIDLMKTSNLELEQRLGTQEDEDNLNVDRQSVISTCEGDLVGVVGGAESDDDISVADHTADRLSSTKDGRERQGSVVVADDISSVYDRYRVEWEERMMQLKESLYRAKGLVKQNAEKELPLEKKS